MNKAGKAIRAEEKKITSLDDLRHLMATEFADGLSYTVAIVFGLAYIVGYKHPSDIPHLEVGDNDSFLPRGYWLNGEIKPYSNSKFIKWQNANMGCE